VIPIHIQAAIEFSVFKTLNSLSQQAKWISWATMRKRLSRSVSE
jgi:cell division inhibitor SulA